jgi:hypothetical protein
MKNNNKMQQQKQQIAEYVPAKDKMDIEIEEMRMLMVKMSQRRHEGEKHFFPWDAGASYLHQIIILTRPRGSSFH